HHDCAVLEWNPVRKEEHISTRNLDELGVASVAMLSNHLPFSAELFVTATAKIAATAADRRVHIHTLSGRNGVDVSPDILHAPRYLGPERNGEGINRGVAGAIDRVRRTNPA